MHMDLGIIIIISKYIGDTKRHGSTYLSDPQNHMFLIRCTHSYGSVRRAETG